MDGVRSCPAFPAPIVGTFCAGWAIGAALCAKVWAMTSATRLPTVNGLAQICFVLFPVVIAVGYTSLAARMSARGWGWPSVRAALAGIACACLGVLVL